MALQNETRAAKNALKASLVTKAKERTMGARTLP